MTVAQRMREITNGANQDREQKRIKAHSKYVAKLVESKITKMAMKGRTNAEIKVGRHYSPTMTYNAFAERGFDVKQNSRNGRAILVVKW